VWHYYRLYAVGKAASCDHTGTHMEFNYEPTDNDEVHVFWEKLHSVIGRKPYEPTHSSMCQWAKSDIEAQKQTVPSSIH